MKIDEERGKRLKALIEPRKCGLITKGLTYVKLEFQKEREKTRQKKMFDEIIAKNFSGLVKKKKTHKFTDSRNLRIPKQDMLFVVVYLLNCVRLFAISCTVAHQALLSMGFPRQEYWSGLPFPSPRIFPVQELNPHLPFSR